jgi:peptidoglycan-N-acetylglucosamine deacetylase
MLKEARNAVVDWMPASVIVRRGRRRLRAVALTFDDGPCAETPALLQALDALDVRATFFVVGQECEAFPQHLDAIVAAGHEVAGHGYTHSVFPELSGRALRSELSRTARLLPPTTQRPFVRPPRGAVTATSLARTWAAGFRTALWTLDSDDCRSNDARFVAARSQRARPGDIVLLHEGQSWTIDALPLFVPELRARGLGLVPMGELVDRTHRR